MCIVSYHSVKGKIPLYQALSDLLTLFLNEHTALDVICHSAVSFSVSALEAWEVQARNMKKGTGEKKKAQKKKCKLYIHEPQPFLPHYFFVSSTWSSLCSMWRSMGHCLRWPPSSVCPYSLGLQHPIVYTSRGSTSIFTAICTIFFHLL